MKKVVITFSKPPYGKAHFIEGLRLASGMSFNEHRTKLIFLGKGVWCALKNVNRAPAQQFLEVIKESGYPLYVERESLKENGIDERDIDNMFRVVSEEEVAAMIRESDIQLGM